jgi:hypothetical protein
MFHNFHLSIPTPPHITNHSTQKRLCKVDHLLLV